MIPDDDVKSPKKQRRSLDVKSPIKSSKGIKKEVTENEQVKGIQKEVTNEGEVKNVNKKTPKGTHTEKKKRKKSLEPELDVKAESKAAIKVMSKRARLSYDGDQSVINEGGKIVRKCRSSYCPASHPICFARASAR